MGYWVEVELFEPLWVPDEPVAPVVVDPDAEPEEDPALDDPDVPDDEPEAVPVPVPELEAGAEAPG